MIKITYNHQSPFAHRFISHLDEQQAAQILAKTTKQQRQSGSKQQYRYSYRKPSQGQGPMTPQQTKILTQFNNNRDSYPRHDQVMETRFGDVDIGKKKTKSSDLLMTDKREVRDLADGLLSQFQSEEASNVQALKQSYLRLWYEKMALDSSYAALQAENSKKDQLISQMRQQLGNRNSQVQQGSGPTFFNPQTPMHSILHNKSGYPSNASGSTQQQTGSQWNSMHPRSNTAVRSQF